MADFLSDFTFLNTFQESFSEFWEILRGADFCMTPLVVPMLFRFCLTRLSYIFLNIQSFLIAFLVLTLVILFDYFQFLHLPLQLFTIRYECIHSVILYSNSFRRCAFFLCSFLGPAMLIVTSSALLDASWSVLGYSSKIAELISVWPRSTVHYTAGVCLVWMNLQSLLSFAPDWFKCDQTYHDHFSLSP